MEIAQGSIRRNPHSVNVKRDLTPAEVLILHAVHFKNAQGSPLGADFAVYGEAITVDVPAKPAEDATFNQITGHRTEAAPAVPAKTHRRTNAEEVARLKKVYANARVRQDDGSDLGAFVAIFGSSLMPKLPQTFDEIEEAVGITFPPLSEAKPAESEAAAYRAALLVKPRHEIVKLALEAKLQVGVADDNATIVDRLIAASAPVKGNDVPVKTLAGLTKNELLEIAELRGVPGVSSADKKEDIIAAIEQATA